MIAPPLFKRLLSWLQSAPIDDPIDRRNAPVMQLLLLFYGVMLPANWVWHIVTGGLGAHARVVLVVDMVVAAMSWVGIRLIRRGRFRPAVKLFIGLLIGALAITFALAGVQAQLIDPAPTMLSLSIAGLVLGRRALWTVWALLLGVFAVGFTTSVRLALARGDSWQRAVENGPAVVITYTLVTIILDRTVAALRESLAEARQRQAQLLREMHARERAQAQLLHAQKLEVTGRLASGVAHDFQNVLDVVLGFARQRHAGDEFDASHRTLFLEESLEGVESAALRGTTLTRKMLSFARQELSRPEVFDMVDALDTIRPMLRQMFPPSVRIDYQATTGPVFIRLDRGEFDLMLLNIAANARDAMAEGGRFTLAVSRLDAEVRLALHDTGCGMEPEVLRQVFEPFFTTKPASGGTGLGLSVIHDLILEASGRIYADSVIGTGTTFHIVLPLAPASPDALAQAVLPNT